MKRIQVVRLTAPLAAVGLAALGLALGGTAAAATGGCPSASSMSTDSEATAASLTPGAPPAVITAVRVGHHDGCDRVTVEYTGALSGYDVGYVPKVVSDASGQTVPLEGSAFVSVALHHTSTTHHAPQQDIKPEFAVLREVRGAGDFEGTTSYGLGLSSKQPFAVTTLSSPNRVVIDIRSPSQVTKVPSGGVATGAGSTSHTSRTLLVVLAASLAAAGAGLFAIRWAAVRR
ncbi:MAG: hypothetical protein ACJ735_07785 [Actinomycetes bacterium]